MRYNQKLISKAFDTDFEQVLKSKGYKYFKDGDYNLNIIGIRSKESKTTVDVFDDVIVIIWKVGDNKYIEVFPITTDPGLYYLKNTLSNKGCAILKPGQYRSAWKIGLHQGKYKALVQNKSVTVYRDNDEDNNLDYVNEQTGMFGINIHKAGTESSQVHNWSAGCQVFARVIDYNKFMNIVNNASKKYGDIFTYTLLNEEDIK